jgi:hypothetical protein
MDQSMTQLQPELTPDEWRRICDALRYLGRDLHHRSFSVTPERRELLWQEMDQCLALADRISSVQVDPIDLER